MSSSRTVSVEPTYCRGSVSPFTYGSCTAQLLVLLVEFADPDSVGCLACSVPWF